MKIDTDKLIDAPTLLDELFAPDCRPTMRTLRRWTACRVIPYHKIGGKVYFDLPKVRESLARKNRVSCL